MISLIWNVSILSNTHPSEGNTCRWCLVASPPHTEDSWVGEMGWGVPCVPSWCAFLAPAATAVPECFRESCMIPNAWFLACGRGVLGVKIGSKNMLGLSSVLSKRIKSLTTLAAVGRQSWFGEDPASKSNFWWTPSLPLLEMFVFRFFTPAFFSLLS